MEDQRPVYNLDEALAAVGFGKYQGFVMGYAGLGLFVEAMEIMILSFIGPVVKSEWGLSSSQESLLTTVVFAGMLIGTYSWGLVSDNYGRRRGFLGMTAVATGAGFLSSFAPNYIWLLISRCVVGFGMGSGPVFYSWFLEFLPASNRGLWMVVFSTFWSFGTISEAALAWIVMPRLNWRWLLALSSLPSFVLLLFYRYIPESPRYLCMKGRTSEAHQILEKIASCNGKELPRGLLTSDSGSRQDGEYASATDTPLLSSSGKKNVKFESGFSTLRMLFSSKLTRITLLLWGISFGNSFSYYAIVLLTSELSSGNSKCGSTILLLGESHNSNVYRDMFVTSLAELPGLAVAAILVDRVGRKVSLEIMYILACILLVPLIFKQSDILTTALLFGSRMCTNGAFTIGSIYAPELYPTPVRATGGGIASAMGRIGGMVCPLIAVGLVTSCQQAAAITMLELVLVISAICTLLMPFETTGRELSDTIPSDET